MKKSLILAAMLSVGYAAAQYDEKVGINTENPSATLNVKTKNNTTSPKNLELENAGGTKLMTVLNSGKVGIGIEAPDRPLHIQHGDVHKMRFQHAGVNDMWTDFGKRDSGVFIITNWANGKWNPGISVRNEGNVAIGGESADERLDVHGKVKVRSLFNELGTDTDKIVVVGNTGVLKSVDRSTIGGNTGETTLGALTGVMYKAESITQQEWIDKKVFAYVHTGSGGIQLPDPSKYTNKIISVNNSYTAQLEYFGNVPVSYSALDAGKGHLLMSDGSKWYIIGGSY